MINLLSYEITLSIGTIKKKSPFQGIFIIITTSSTQTQTLSRCILYIFQINHQNDQFIFLSLYIRQIKPLLVT